MLWAPRPGFLAQVAVQPRCVAAQGVLWLEPLVLSQLDRQQVQRGDPACADSSKAAVRAVLTLGSLEHVQAEQPTDRADSRQPNECVWTPSYIWSYVCLS
jgi:hypothetical protein